MKSPRKLNLGVVTPKELREAYKAALASGAEMSYTGSGHVKVSNSLGTVIGPSTSKSYGHAVRNTKQQLKKIGAV